MGNEENLVSKNFFLATPASISGYKNELQNSTRKNTYFSIEKPKFKAKMKSVMRVEQNFFDSFNGVSREEYN